MATEGYGYRPPEPEERERAARQAAAASARKETRDVVRPILMAIGLLLVLAFLVWVGEVLGWFAALLPGGLSGLGGAFWGAIAVIGLALAFAAWRVLRR